MTDLKEISRDELVELATAMGLGVGKVDIPESITRLVNFIYAAGYALGAKETTEALLNG